LNQKIQTRLEYGADFGSLLNTKKLNYMLIIRVIVSFLKDKEYLELLLTTTIVLLFGSIIFHFVEGWRWLDSIYFCVITLTTIGYGDFSPRTDIGKVFNMFYIVIGLGLILSFIRTVYDHYAKVKQAQRNK